MAAKPIDAKKASGLRFYKANHKIKSNEAAWPGFIEEQLKWAIQMKQVIQNLGLQGKTYNKVCLLTCELVKLANKTPAIAENTILSALAVYIGCVSD